MDAIPIIGLDRRLVVVARDRYASVDDVRARIDACSQFLDAIPPEAQAMGAALPRLADGTIFDPRHMGKDAMAHMSPEQFAALTKQIRAFSETAAANLTDRKRPSRPS